MVLTLVSFAFANFDVLKNNIKEFEHRLRWAVLSQIFRGPLKYGDYDLKDIDVHLLWWQVFKDILYRLINLLEEAQSFLSLN